MADLSYQVSVETQQAQQQIRNLQASMQNLQKSFDGVSKGLVRVRDGLLAAFAVNTFFKTTSSFEDMRTALNFLYKDAARGSAVFNDIKKFAATTQFSVEDLTNTVIQLKASGLTPTIEQLRFFADVTKNTINPIQSLEAMTALYAKTVGGGLGLDDLNRLMNAGIPVYKILAEELGIDRDRISQLGQTAKGAQVILQGLQQGLQKLYGGASASGANTLTQAFSNFKDSVANAFDTIGQSGFNQTLKEILSSVSEFISKNNQLFVSIGKGLGGALKFAADNFRLLVAAATPFFVVMAVEKVVALSKAFLALGAILRKNPLFLIATGLLVAAEATGLLDKAFASLEKRFSTTGEASGEVTQGLDQGVTPATEDLTSKVNELDQAYQKFRAGLTSTVEQFKKANEQTLAALNLETQLIGATSETQRIRRAELDITNKLQNEIQKLTDEKAKLTESERKQGRGADIDATIEKLKKQADIDKATTSEAIRNSESRQAAYAVEQFQIQNRISFEDKLMALQKEMAQGAMTDIEKKYDDIRRAADEAALAAIRAEEARINRRLTTNEAQKYYDEARKGTDILIDRQRAAYESSRTFETGWNKAFKTYVENATDAAKQAEQIFGKVTQGMEDMIVNFAKTGKFEFKSFINSILEDLLRSQIRQTMAQIFNIGNSQNTSGSGFFGSIGKMLGFANGGIIPTNAPVLVGERGPELLSGAAGRNVTPNNQLGMGPSYVTYNISAVDAMSFKQLVASDPTFIHAVAQQGARGIPSTRR